MKTNSKNLEKKTLNELIRIIKELEHELRESKKEAQYTRRCINRIKKNVSNMKVRYEELVDIVEQEEIDKYRLAQLAESPTTNNCPKCKSENIITLDLNMFYKKSCGDCGYVLEKEFIGNNDIQKAS